MSTPKRSTPPKKTRRYTCAGCGFSFVVKAGSWAAWELAQTHFAEHPKKCRGTEQRWESETVDDLGTGKAPARSPA